MPIHTHCGPGKGCEVLGDSGSSHKIRGLRSSMILHAKRTILDHISLLASSWLGPPPPLGAWGLALGHLHIMIVRIETSSLSSYVSVFFNSTNYCELRTANTPKRSPDDSGGAKSDWKGQLHQVKCIECQPFVPKPTRLSLPHSCEVDEWQIVSWMTNCFNFVRGCWKSLGLGSSSWR